MKAFSVWLLAVLCAVALAVSHGSADETAPVEIYTPEDMLRIAENPDGSYILMCDLDLSSVEWPAFTFRGTFDGNDHMLINLRFGDVSSETQVTYDGNRKTYDTHFAGLFAILDHACVKNVRLPGLTLSKTYEGDCFLGGIAGYANESTIENCEISGTISLDVTGRMFGVGGVLGYGNAVIRNCKVDVTLINTDLDAAHRDEEFLGGICAAGYPDIDACEITLAGFLSDHGYVHSGGLVGMFGGLYCIFLVYVLPIFGIIKAIEVTKRDKKLALAWVALGLNIMALTPGVIAILIAILSAVMRASGGYYY